MYRFHNQHLIIKEIEHVDVKYFYDTMFVSIHHFVNPFMKNKFPIEKKQNFLFLQTSSCSSSIESALEFRRISISSSLSRYRSSSLNE
jgi:hypothetical protein